MTAGRLLITGSCGLIGHAVVEAARNRFSCISSDVRQGDDGDGFVELDLCDGRAVIAAVEFMRPSYVVHSAAISHAGLAEADPLRAIEINTGGTANLLEAVRRVGVKRFVFISSAVVYESYADAELVDEGARLEPRSIYGASKIAAEALVHAYEKSFDLPAVILRPCSVYGPRRQTYSVPGYLVASALDGVPANVTDAGHALDFMHVDDVVGAVLLALEIDAALGKVYNIATGIRSSYSEIAAIVCRIIPQARIVLLEGKADLGAEPSLDVERARRELGFTCRLDIEAGLAALALSLSTNPEHKRLAREAASALPAGLSHSVSRR